MKRDINIVHGLSACGCFRQAMRPGPGEILVHLDVLTLGPLPAFESVSQWRQARLEFWKSMDSTAEFEPDSFEHDLLVRHDALRNAARINLWVGKSAADQLFLAWMVQLLKYLDVDFERIAIIQFDRMPERDMDIWGLGLLNPEQIRRRPAPTKPSNAAFSELDRAWRAATSPNPAEFLGYVSGDSPSAMPFLRPGLRTLLARYPDAQTGLGRWEHELLKQVQKHGPRASRVIGYSIGESWDADMVGDLYLFSRLQYLGDTGLHNPLVLLTGNPALMRECQVQLTETGERVLQGQTNHVEINGIDDWILGVHLDFTEGRVWYRNGELLELRGA